MKRIKIEHYFSVVINLMGLLVFILFFHLDASPAHTYSLLLSSYSNDSIRYVPKQMAMKRIVLCTWSVDIIANIFSISNTYVLMYVLYVHIAHVMERETIWKSTPFSSLKPYFYNSISILFIANFLFLTLTSFHISVYSSLLAQYEPAVT